MEKRLRMRGRRKKERRDGEGSEEERGRAGEMVVNDNKSKMRQP